MTEFFKPHSDAVKVAPTVTLVEQKPINRSVSRMGGRVFCTPEANEAIKKLTEEIGPIMFYQPGGPSDCIFPICFRLWEFIASGNDILFGKLDNIPVYIDKRRAQNWKYFQLVLDVAPGAPRSFSIAAGDNLHFVSRSSIMNPEFFLM